MLSFKDEIKELQSKYNKNNVQLAKEMDCNPVTISRLFKEEFIPSEDMLWKIKSSLPAFDIELWRIYFGKMPDEFYEACRKHPALALELIIDLIAIISSSNPEEAYKNYAHQSNQTE